MRRHLPFLILLAIALLAGLLSAGRYGQTWDDQGLWDYRAATLANYRALFTGDAATHAGPPNLRYYGPAFLLFSAGVDALAKLINPGLANLTTWHISTLLSFLAGLAAFYALALRMVQREAALWASLLFASQPLLWGHALINGKDIPFMGLFLLAIALGLRALDRVDKAPGAPRPIDWQHPALRRLGTWLLGLAAAWLLWLALAPALENALTNWLAAAQSAPAASWQARLLATLAPEIGSRPLAGYVAKALLYAQGLLGGLLALLLVLQLGRLLRATPSLRARLADWASAVDRRSLADALRSPALWAAGLALGALMAVRVLGLFAGGLVLLYALIKKRKAALPLALVYLPIAFLTLFLLWPALWGAPISHFWESLSLMSQFPWNGPVLFNGRIYEAVDLPASFLPTLLLIQLTLPALALIALGLWRALQRRSWLLGLYALWFLAPLLYTLAFDSTLYDNFRQYLFILPPLFLLAALGIDWLLGRVRPAWAGRLALAVLVLGAAASIRQLQPYEYVHYNALVGGLPGAAERYELDYWATALTEATHQLNDVAPEDARLIVWGPDHVVQASARPDLLVEGLNGGRYDILSGYHYALINVRAGTGNNAYPEIEALFSIQRQGVDLALVKALDCDCAPEGAAP